ncbi:MAG: hypothetical protein NZM12_01795, partial [Steroidobacteraceae bacterium]|nr:hypothetical protein [Steroidobacteraceae bacterium]
MAIPRRLFLQGGATVAAFPAAAMRRTDERARGVFDYLIAGAGTAGIPAAIFAARRGARAQTPHGVRTYRGRHVMLCTGGYAMNPDAFFRHSGYPAFAAGDSSARTNRARISASSRCSGCRICA